MKLPLKTSKTQSNAPEKVDVVEPEDSDQPSFIGESSARDIMALRERKVAAMRAVFDDMVAQEKEIDQRIKNWLDEAKNWWEFSRGMFEK